MHIVPIQSELDMYNCFKKHKCFFKGIVSRDWGGLQMILLGRLEVFIISASSFYLFLSTFSYRIFKNGRLSGASFQHNL